MFIARAFSWTFAALLAAQSAAALADTRIFSVRTNAPDVTVEKALIGGKALVLVGRGDGATLFRIDSPDGAVACANHLLFETSSGEKVDLAADLCALNWDVAIEVRGGSAAATPPAAEPVRPAEPAPPAATPPDAAVATPPAEPASETPPAEPAPATPADDSGSFIQTVTINADDPAAAITGVSLDGQNFAIAGHEGAAVKIEVKGDAKGITCQRDVGLVLSDGRRVTRRLNICLNDFKVVVSLAEEAEPLPAGPPAATPDAATAEAPPAAAPAPPPTEAPGVPMDGGAGSVWAFSSAGANATLSLGVPQTDSSQFVATCTKATGAIVVSLLETESGVNPGSPMQVSFSSASFSKTYPGVASPVDQMSGSSHPQVKLAVGDPFWQSLIRDAAMTVSVPGKTPLSLSLKGSAAPVRQFLAACSPVPVVVEPAKPLNPLNPGNPPVVARPRSGAVVVEYFCVDGSRLAVSYDGDRAVVSEAGAPPLVLNWRPGGAVARYTAGSARLANRGGEIRFTRFGEPVRTCQPR